VLGPEAPLIALGSVVGMVVVALVRVDDRGTTVLATAGSFSAISALFGGPLVAGYLLLEGGIGAGTALLPPLLPGLVAAAVGYVLFSGLGSWGGINEAPLTVPTLPVYDHTRILELLLAIVVGLVAGVAVWAVRQIGSRVLTAASRRWSLVLLAGGLAV